MLLAIVISATALMVAKIMEFMVRVEEGEADRFGTFRFILELAVFGLLAFQIVDLSIDFKLASMSAPMQMMPPMIPQGEPKL